MNRICLLLAALASAYALEYPASTTGYYGVCEGDSCWARVRVSDVFTISGSVTAVVSAGGPIHPHNGVGSEVHFPTMTFTTVLTHPRVVVPVVSTHHVYPMNSVAVVSGCDCHGAPSRCGLDGEIRVDETIVQRGFRAGTETSVGCASDGPTRACVMLTAGLDEEEEVVHLDTSIFRACFYNETANETVCAQANMGMDRLDTGMTLLTPLTHVVSGYACKRGDGVKMVCRASKTSDFTWTGPYAVRRTPSSAIVTPSISEMAQLIDVTEGEVCNSQWESASEIEPNAVSYPISTNITCDEGLCTIPEYEHPLEVRLFHTAKHPVNVVPITRAAAISVDGARVIQLTLAEYPLTPSYAWVYRTDCDGCTGSFVRLTGRITNFPLGHASNYDNWGVNTASRALHVKFASSRRLKHLDPIDVSSTVGAATESMTVVEHRPSGDGGSIAFPWWAGVLVGIGAVAVGWVSWKNRSRFQCRKAKTRTDAPVMV